MADNTISWQLLEYTGKFTPTAVGAKKTPQIVLHCKRLDKEVVNGDIKFFQGAFKGEGKEEASAVLDDIKAKGAGATFVAIKEKKVNPQDINKPFWNVVDLKPETKWGERPMSTFTKFNNTGKTNDNGTGAQIGNALKLAVETLGAGKTVEQYKARAWELILLGDALRTELETHRSKSTDTFNAAANNQQQQHAAAQSSFENDSDVPF